MKILKWISITLGSVIIISSISFLLIYILSEIRINHIYEQTTSASIALPQDSIGLAEGKRLFISRGCSSCHAENLSGVIFIDTPSLGTLSGSNLTRGIGGIGNQYKDNDFILAIREGIGIDKKPLIYMPSHEYQNMNNNQIAAIIAYIRSVHAVDHTPNLELGWLMRINFLLGKVPLLAAEVIDHHRPISASIPAQASIKYGEYLSDTCKGCHGKTLSGGAVPGAPENLPQASNLRQNAAIQKWERSDFFQAMRYGKRPDGSSINPFMPWNNFKKMTDTELEALWLYLKTLK